jgi:hypothetical protein
VSDPVRGSDPNGPAETGTRRPRED